MEETTPASIARSVVPALIAAGGKVLTSNATESGAYGFVKVQMPDGVVVTINIEID